MKASLMILSTCFLLASNALLAQENTESVQVVKETIRTHGGVIGDPAFLEAGDWWNLYFAEKNDPLKRSIKAVKVLHVSSEHPGWVLIAVPKSRDEHRSIFGPAAKAHDDDSVEMREVLEEWEKTVSQWKTVWVNLDFVVSASRLAKNPSQEEEVTVGSGAEELDATTKEMLRYMEKMEKEANEAYGVALSDKRSLEKTVLRINQVLQTDYALLEPKPITVDRLREAIKAKIDTLAKSENEDRMQLVKALQRVLAEERLPDRYLFFLAPTSAGYKKQSLDDGVLDKKVVNLSYNLSVPVAVGRETTQTVRLTSLNEKFFIKKRMSSERVVGSNIDSNR